MGQQTFDAVLSISVNCSGVKIPFTTSGDQRLIVIVCRIAQAGEGVDDEDAVGSPRVWTAKVSAIASFIGVGPVVDHLDGGAERLRFAVDDGAKCASLALVADSAEFDVGDLIRAFMEDEFLKDV